MARHEHPSSPACCAHRRVTRRRTRRGNHYARCATCGLLLVPAWAAAVLIALDFGGTP